MVSFIMPAWKRSFLRQAIKSILSQGYTDFELVVVDDASPENLEEVVREFNDSRIIYKRNKVNIGGRDLVAAWNHAMEYAKGEFCVLASDDDEYAPGYLTEMMRLAEKYRDVDVFHCRLAFIDSEGKRTGVSEIRSEYESGSEFLYNRAVRRMRQYAPDFMFRTEALRRIGGFVSFPRAWFSDDATWISLAKEHGVAYSSQVLFSWRSSGENISTLFSDVTEKLKAGEAYLEWLKSYMKDFAPVLEKDREMLLKSDKGVGYAVDHISFWVLHNAKFKDAVRAVLTVYPSFRMRVGFIFRMCKVASRRLFRRGKF